MNVKQRTIRYKSPLRYPGGKASLVPFVKQLFLDNDLVGGVYAEPYAGGASVGLALLLDGFVSRIYINDADPAVYAFWRSCLNETAALADLVRCTHVSVAEWDHQKRIYERGLAASPLQLGFSAFFLNRTNRSGIISSAGIIGGRAQSGQWRIDARYNAEELAQRIERIGEHRKQIVLSGDDAGVFLLRVPRRLPQRALLYLDPPYFIKGQRRLYANYYEPGDHAAISEIVRRLSCKWIVSYDYVPEIKRLYKGYRSLSYSLRYSASSSASGDEIMFFSDGTVVPRLSGSSLSLYKSMRKRSAA